MKSALKKLLLSLGTSVIVVACLVHLTWAVLLVIDNPQSATPIHWLFSFVPNRFALAYVLAFAALASFGSLIELDKCKMRAFWFVALQQIIMLVTAYGAYHAIRLGAYADGTQVSRVHLCGDQCTFIWAGVVHTVAVVVLLGGFYQEEKL